MSQRRLANLDALRQQSGQALPEGEWLTVTQQMVNDFASATGDFQWIHVDAERSSRESPFRKPVAHGFLSLSLLSKLLGDLIHIDSVKMGVNYGLNKVRFPHPVVVGSRVRLVASIAKVEDYAENGVKVTWDCVVAIEKSGKPACVAEFVSLMFEKKSL